MVQIAIKYSVMCYFKFWLALRTLRLCLDVVGFTSIYICWSGLGWNLVQDPLQSIPTHVDWCESDYIQTMPQWWLKWCEMLWVFICWKDQPFDALLIAACQTQESRRHEVLARFMDGGCLVIWFTKGRIYIWLCHVEKVHMVWSKAHHPPINRHSNMHES